MVFYVHWRMKLGMLLSSCDLVITLYFFVELMPFFSLSCSLQFSTAVTKKWKYRMELHDQNKEKMVASNCSCMNWPSLKWDFFFVFAKNISFIQGISNLVTSQQFLGIISALFLFRIFVFFIGDTWSTQTTYSTSILNWTKGRKYGINSLAAFLCYWTEELYVKFHFL